MTYLEAIQFLYGLQLFGAHFGLERSHRLAQLTGNPQDKLRFIHVAGTNGKGSTCAILEGIYRAAGLRVGLFTSPHLISFRERIQVNRQLIAESKLVRLVEKIQPLLKEFPTGNHPTMFEVVTVMALKYFAEQKCELVIWETGLGGRLDATNIVIPLASVITNIAFDHQQWLGDTLGKIAAEKAGIIKPRVPVITGAEKPEAFAVIEEVAQKQKAPLRILAAEDSRCLEGTALPLLGKHQKQNAALALATVEVLQKQIPIAVEKIREGLAKVQWAGRLQLIQRNAGQKILLDGAHNIVGIEALRASLPEAGAPSRCTFIIGFLGDKDWRMMCELLALLAGKIFTVPVASERTVPAHELAAACRSANPKAKVFVCKNFSEALTACDNEPFIIVTGSLYLVGEALEQLELPSGNTGERSLNEWKTR